MTTAAPPRSDPQSGRTPRPGGEPGTPRVASVAEDRAQEPTTAQVRSWARGQGIDVPPRGKLRAAIWDAYQAAHPRRP
ncbi:Lsr2 family DNA-binding protein [Streptomyces sp. NBC_00576]|uniref:Lsr2 family DNA-binding protein n=1 Tax=Streptomyces sp. NBC_00576 TaxID=2903665 RepID=UPI003FCDD948